MKDKSDEEDNTEKQISKINKSSKIKCPYCYEDNNPLSENFESKITCNKCKKIIFFIK